MPNLRRLLPAGGRTPAPTALLSTAPDRRPSAAGRYLGLIPPVYRTGHRRAVPVRLPSGVTLRADHHWPVGRTGRPIPAATVLVRTPYNRDFAVDARALAREGFHVLVVSSRGLYGSEGTFDAPMLGEAEDGQGVVAWLRRRPWFDGRLLTWGQSYLGFTQWALAMDPPPELRAMVVRVGPHRFVEAAYPGGAPAMGSTLYWALGIVNQTDRPLPLQLLGAYRGDIDRLALAVANRPLIESYPLATGKQVGFFEEWITHAPEDPWWLQADHTEALTRVNVPVLLQGGWFDVFRDYTLEQYRILHGRGVDVHMTIGPWSHGDARLMFGPSFTEAVQWLRSALGEGPRSRRLPVRVAVTGAGTDQWRELPAWPPPGPEADWLLAGPAEPQGPGRLIPAPGAPGDDVVSDPGTDVAPAPGTDVVPVPGADADAGLAFEADVVSAPGADADSDPRVEIPVTDPDAVAVTGPSGADLPVTGPVGAGLPSTGPAEPSPAEPGPDPARVTSWEWDPGLPTPAIGGAGLSGSVGSVDNRPLEARSDVVTFTGPALREPFEVLGAVRAHLYVTTTAASADFFVRLCDVHPSGASMNVCDAVVRVGRASGTGPRPGPDGVVPLETELGQIAHRFCAGHRLRLQISSGAYPRILPNTGLLEPYAIAVRAVRATQAVLHDEDHPSHLSMPVLPIPATDPPPRPARGRPRPPIAR